MSDLDLAELTASALERVREQNPLVHNITNFVVMNDTANALLAVGASPVMAHAIAEVREMVAYAGALVLNIGTLEDPWIDAMLAAADEANKRNIPIVLDPVGAGATVFRTATADRIMRAAHMAVVRGNAGEMAAIAGLGGEVRGVDSVSAVLPDVAVRVVATRTHGAAVASGPEDYVGDRTRLATIHNGDPLMARITGSGCMATAMIGAFLAVEPDPFLAAAEAVIAYDIAGELAAAKSAGPGTFRQQLMDAIAGLDRAAILAGTRATVREVHGE
jgi:hydroxyethylthiazole kinase